MLGTNMGVCSWTSAGSASDTDSATEQLGWCSSTPRVVGRTVTAMRGAAGVHDDEHVARANFRSAH